jgi:hypothetical protein
VESGRTLGSACALRDRLFWFKSPAVREAGPPASPASEGGGRS